jgi:hypothetical protein
MASMAYVLPEAVPADRVSTKRSAGQRSEEPRHESGTADLHALYPRQDEIVAVAHVGMTISAPRNPVASATSTAKRAIVRNEPA